MQMKRFVSFVAAIASIAAFAASGSAFAAQDSPCDRECLVDMMQQYLAALVKHDPSAVPLSEEIKFTENTANIPVGRGLWVTASSGPTDFQIYAADPIAQQVACLVMMQENGDQNVLLGARLKIVDGKISEAEHLAIRNGDLSEHGLAGLQKPRPGLIEDVPPSERIQRWELLRIGRTYYEALTKEDGTLAPFADECARHENGMITAGTTPAKPKGKPAPEPDPEREKILKALEALGPDARKCSGQISTAAFSYISEIRNRRVEIADVQKGLVVGFSMFSHDSTVKEYETKLPNGEAIKRPSYQGTFNLPAMHICKIRQGKIYEIEAIGFALPYGTKSGWE
jgi:hypothetical protein